jgi:integrase
LQARYRIAVDMGVGLGLRQGEALGLGLDDLDFEKHVVNVRRQLRWDYRARPYFCLPKGQKTREVPMSPNFEKRMKEHIAQFPPIECTLPWRNPEPPTSPLEAKQRKPITVKLLLSTTKANRVFYRTFNDRSWKPALAAAGVIKVVGSIQKKSGSRVRTYPVFEESREDMFHVLRHTFASVQLEAGESIVSVSKWLGHSTPNVTLNHYAHFMPEAGRRGMGAMDSWLDDDLDQDLPENSLEDD